MAKIAVIVSNPCTTDARVIKMIRAAHEAGYEVTVFCIKKPNVQYFEYVNGVDYHRLEWQPVNCILNEGFIRCLSIINKKFARFIAIKLVPYLKYRTFQNVFSTFIAEENPDIIHAHDLICLPAAFKAAELCKAKIIYDAHELEVHRNPPLPFLQKMFVSYIEKKYGSKAHAVNTVGKLIKENLEKHLNRDDINIIYNSPTIKPTTLNIRKDLRLNDHVKILLYVGKIAIGRGIETIIPNLSYLGNDVVFACVGPCNREIKVKMISLAEKYNVSDKFYILPEVSFEHVTDYIRGADLGIIQLDTLPLSYKLAMPNKLFEMSFANIPIISNQLPEIEMFLKEFGNGVIIDFYESTQLGYLINKVFYNKNNYKMDKEKSKRLYDEYSWDIQVKKLLNIYNQLLEN